MIPIEQRDLVKVLPLLTVLGISSMIGRAEAAPLEKPYHATARASSIYNADLPADHATDRDRSTRWCSSEPYGKQEWLQVDLGKILPIGRVEIFWEVAFGKGYQLSTSDNAKDWKIIFKSGAGDGGRDVLNHLKASARYLRLECLEHGTIHGFSIWELNAYPSATSRMADVVMPDFDYLPPKPPKPAKPHSLELNYFWRS
ncbi:discoidin domain-containing protein (plasmid) [Verrucomicrobiaceae bacterium 227]